MLNKFCFLLTLTLFGSNIFAQVDPQFPYAQAKDYEVGPIKVIGADNFDHSAIRLIAGLRQGQIIQIPGDKITNAIKNLWKEGLFSDVNIYSDKELDGIVYLVISLKARPKLSRFQIRGVPKREVDKIRDEINLFSGKTINENLVFNTKNKIKAFYREKGYNNAVIEVKSIPDSLMNNSELFAINITKGKRVKIEKIIITGNTKIPTWRVKMLLKDTKQKSNIRFWKRSKFNEASFDRDKKSVLDKFQGKGLRDACFKLDTVYSSNPSRLTVVLEISEEKPYYFGNFTWIGNTKFSSGMLDTVLGIKYGDPYNKALLEERLKASQDGRDVTSLYMDRGHLFYQMIPQEVGVDSSHINYEVRMIEGKEARVRNIIIKGNSKTNDHVIRREIRTKPGDLFSRTDIIRTQRELAALGYFNPQAFQVNPIPNPTDGTVDIEYIVEEKSSDQVELSGGYGGGRIIGTLGLSFNNFSTKNMFKPNQWTPLPSGDGQRLSIRAQTNGKYYQSYNFSFTEPWLGGKKPNSLSWWVTHTQSGNNFSRKNASYSGVAITGMGVGFGRRKKIPDDWFQAYYELSYQYYDVKNSQIFKTLPTGYANDISLKYIISRNSVDQPIYPREGSKIQMSMKSSLPYFLFDNKDYSNATSQERYKFLEYYKLKFTGEWYFPISRDKKLVLSPRFGFAFLGAYNKARGLTPFERFTLGGSGMSGQGMGSYFGGQEIIALRGYEDNGINSVGGDPIISKMTMELRYPISLNPQATFYVTAWGEAGNTFVSAKTFNPFHLKRAAGFGLRAFLPMFGMLGIDYGWGFDGLDPHSSGYLGGDDLQRNLKGYKGRLTFTIGANIGEL
jgi:outer membrane protein insertion porin family